MLEGRDCQRHETEHSKRLRTQSEHHDLAEWHAALAELVQDPIRAEPDTRHHDC